MTEGLFKDSLKAAAEILEEELITMTLPTLSSRACEDIYPIRNMAQMKTANRPYY